MDQIQEIIVNNEKQMRKLAKSIFKKVTFPNLILLDGDLGAGKTTFTKYFCKAAGVTDTVTSPTFTIMREYKGKRNSIIHFDLYRIDNEEEVQEFGFEEYVFGDTPNQIVLIEWPYNLKQFSYPNAMIIHIEKIDDTKRKVKITTRG